MRKEISKKMKLFSLLAVLLVLVPTSLQGATFVSRYHTLNHCIPNGDDHLLIWEGRGMYFQGSSLNAYMFCGIPTQLNGLDAGNINKVEAYVVDTNQYHNIYARIQIDDTQSYSYYVGANQQTDEAQGRYTLTLSPPSGTFDANDLPYVRFYFNVRGSSLLVQGLGVWKD